MTPLRPRVLLSERSLMNVSAVGIGLSLLFGSGRALALQPLSDFVGAAKTQNLDNKEALATAAQRAQEADQAWSKIGPAFTGRASYTRNQYEAIVSIPSGPGEFRTATITPKNQLDATLTLDVPLVDLGSWSKISAAKASAEAASARVLASADDVQKVVVQTYTRIVASEALVDAAKRSLSAAEANLAIVTQKRSVGTANELEVERAAAEVARSKQSLADAEYTRATSRNALTSLTGLTPTDGAPTLDDDLHEESPLETWLGGSLSSLPSVKAASLDVTAAKKNESAAWDALLPTLSATATERFTNATGFGTSPYWYAGVVATWRVDLYGVDNAKSFASATAVAKVREAKALQAAHDQIFDAWHQVASSLAKSAAARAEVKASQHAAALAHERYAIGTGTQLDVVQADRDAFSADVARIQADADLIYARGLLRIAAGKSPLIGGAS